jgi:hypothetical protein
MHRLLTLLVALLLVASRVPAAEPPTPVDPIRAAQEFRKGKQAVAPLSDTTVIAEAEEFHVQSPGWQAKPFGTNYHAATFANCFLSRQAYLGAPEQCDRTSATIEIEVPKAGRYLALVRYEACYRFETQFRLQIEQNGKNKLDRLYGARDNIKIWAFHEKLKKEVAWSWGASETIVWEGHDAAVDLDAGKARLTLVADKQPEPAARRNVDLVMLTSDEAQVKMRIDKENYLPLDGLLTQAGDVYLKVHNHKESAALTLTVPNGVEHSPYWVHLRHWQPRKIEAIPGQSSDWVEVGSLLDSLSDGQWTLTAAGKGNLLFDLEFGVRGADGKIESIRRIEKQTGNVTLAYYGNTRYSRRIHPVEDVLYDLVDYLKKQPVRGVAPQRTLIYGYGFDPKPGDAKYTAAAKEFVRLIGATALSKEQTEGPGVRDHIDVRGVATKDLEAYCQKLKAAGHAERIAVVSLGDEIGLALPPATDHAGFRAWLKTQKIKASDLDPAAGDDIDKLTYSPTAETAKTKPGLFYYSKLYGHRYGIRQLKERTDILRKYLPNAGIGANFSPHGQPMYLGSTHHWISLFREDGMTMPWGEDYIFQVPVASPQVNFLMVDMFRAGIRGKPDRKIHYYVMAHAPNNTPNAWRRQFYGDIAHGVKVFNLFEFRPRQAAYTENHVNDPAMYQEVRKGLHELGQFEDIVQDGQVRQGDTGLWFSEAAEVWDDNRAPFDAHKRSLYLAICHGRRQVEVVVEGDDLKSYHRLYLTDHHVSRAASKALAEWVNNGGELIATAGAGMFDEFNQPNKTLRDLLGIDQTELIEAKDVIRFEKQDLPFAEPLDQATFTESPVRRTFPIFGARSRAAVKEGIVSLRFRDNSPAHLGKQTGKGITMWYGFLPAFSYLYPALPTRPVDRGATDDAYLHYLPTNTNTSVWSVINGGTSGETPVTCRGKPGTYVESRVIEAKQGTIITLVNWSGKPMQALEVTVTIPTPTAKVELASGKQVQVKREAGKQVFTLDLDVADALILR